MQYQGKALHVQAPQARRPPSLVCARASTETVQSTNTQEDDEDDEDVDIQIEGLTEDYCDDFVCTSSPAVEQTLRSLAKDLVRRKWTPILFAKDVKYRVRIPPIVHVTALLSSCSVSQEQDETNTP